MKPVNSYLGVYPTRTSRISSLDIGTRSLDSVLFQQGKSMLDYDLNVMQSVLKTNIETVARQIFSTSGIVQSNYNLSFNTSTGSVTINPFDAQVYGAAIHVASSTGAITSPRPSNVSYDRTTFLWLEVWYQEIATTGSNETIAPSSAELKDTRMYQYGGVDISPENEYITAPSLIDPVFGAETTRRVQLRWRIRHDSITTQTAGFSSSPSSLSDEIKARGGRSSAFVNDASNNIFYFIRADNYASSSNTDYLSSLKNSLIDFASKNDTGLYIAGRGTADDALLLNTVDGRVYGLPLATIVGTNLTTFSITSKFVLVGLSTASGISVAQNTSLTDTGDAAYQHAAGTPTLAVSAGQAPNKIQLTLSDSSSSSNYTDLYLTPKDGIRPGYVVPTRISVSDPGSETVPSITFLKSTVSSKLGDTGFYYISTPNPSLNVTVATNEVARFSNGGTSTTRMLTAKNLTVDGLSVFSGASTFNGNITLGANTTITGGVNATSVFPRISSASATITGGSISNTTLILYSMSTAPTNAGDTQWDTASKTIKVGGGSNTTYSYGYLGSSSPVAISATNSASSGTSSEAARVDHVHAAPATGLTPATHKASHLSSGSDAFADGDLLNANARVGIKISASGTGTDRATGITGTTVRKRAVQFIAGTGIFLDLSNNSTEALDQLDLKITANNAGVLDESLPSEVTLGSGSSHGISSYVSRRDHRHGLNLTYSTSAATISSGSSSAGNDTAISRGNHQHAMPTYLSNAIGFGSDVTTGATQVDIFGANNYSTSTSALVVRDTNITLGDNGGRIALGGYTAAATYGVFGAISARKLNTTSANSRGYLSLFANSGTGLAEFFRGYNTGGVYIGTSYFSDPGANNLTVGGKIQVFTSGVAANAPATGTTASTGELMRFMAGVSGSNPSGLVSIVGLNAKGLWIQSTDTQSFATNNAIMLNPNGGSVGIGTNAPDETVKLDVSGIVKATDFSGTIGSTSANTGAFTTISASSLITASAGISSTTISASGLITASGGISSTTISTSGLITASGGISSTTISTSGLITASGGISGNVTGNVTGLLTYNTGSATGEANLVYGIMAENDQFRIRIGGDATNAGWAEIATADDGTEPIYVRQYSGVFNTITRTAKLLDDSGNTSFPGTLSADKMSGGAAPRCFIPAAAFTSTVSLSTDATTGQYYYSMAIGNIAYVYLVVPSNYAGGTVTSTISGGVSGTIATSTSSNGNYSTLGTLVANTGYYFRITASSTGNFLGLSLVFG